MSAEGGDGSPLTTWVSLAVAAAALLLSMSHILWQMKNERRKRRGEVVLRAEYHQSNLSVSTEKMGKHWNKYGDSISDRIVSVVRVNAPVTFTQGGWKPCGMHRRRRADFLVGGGPGLQQKPLPYLFQPIPETTGVVTVYIPRPRPKEFERFEKVKVWAKTSAGHVYYSNAVDISRTEMRNFDPSMSSENSE